MSVHFDVDDQGAPNLAGDDEAAQTGGAPIPPESSFVDPVVVWMPEEAQAAMQTIMNIGAFFYGPAWLCEEHEFRRSSANAARLLERIFPKATTGGPVGIGLDVAAVAGDFGAGIAHRRVLMKKGPKQPQQVMSEFGLGREPNPYDPGQSAPAAPPTEPVPAGEVLPTESGGFKFDPRVREALERAAQSGGGLSSMGLSL